MKRFSIKITETALESLNDIFDYIAEVLFAPEAASDQYQHIEDAIYSLSFFPERIKVMNSEPEHSRGIRRLLVDNYSVFFIVSGSTVIILNILYSASDFSARL